MISRRRFFIIIGMGSLFLAYLIFQLRLVIFAPPIAIYFDDMQKVPVGQKVEIRGQTDTLSRISLNGNLISIDKEGVFLERIAVQRGINQITIKAQNRFGRERVKDLTIIGEDAHTL